MAYKLDPVYVARKRWNKVLDQGHHFALCLANDDGTAGLITASARYRWEIERLGRFRPWLLVVDVDAALADLD